MKQLAHVEHASVHLVGSDGASNAKCLQKLTFLKFRRVEADRAHEPSR